ncbi:MAG: hypothetical protein P8X79_18905 [Reinekea sp.]
MIPLCFPKIGVNLWVHLQVQDTTLVYEAGSNKTNQPVVWLYKVITSKRQLT